MTQKTAEEIRGYEYDWLACDRAGHVALLSTAGGGYPPRAFLTDTDAYDRAIEALLAMPVTTPTDRVPPTTGGCANTWKQAAERGLYAFDSDPNGGPYRLAGLPTEPVHISELPAEIRAVASKVELRTLHFATATEISETDIRASETPPKC